MGFKDFVYTIRRKQTPVTEEQFAEMAQQMVQLIQVVREEHAQLAYTLGKYTRTPRALAQLVRAPH